MASSGVGFSLSGYDVSYVWGHTCTMKGTGSSKYKLHFNIMLKLM